MVGEMLYFGTDKPGGTVSAEDWQEFLAEVVTPRFPRGLSVWRASGQWKSDAGSIVSESSYVLNIVHAGGASEEQLLDEVANAYKTKFRQESVLRVRAAVCVTF